MKVIVKNARLGFNDLFKAKAQKGSDVLKFSATLIIGENTSIVYTVDGEKKGAKPDVLNAICEKVLKEKFNGKLPAKAQNWVYNKADGSTTRDEYVNDEGDYWAGIDAETWYISANKPEEKAKNGKMTVLNQIKKPIEANEGILFSGCYVNAVIDVYAFDATDKQGGKGVTASLEGVQLVKTGEPLGFVPTDATEDFDEEEFEEDSIDEADGL